MEIIIAGYYNKATIKSGSSTVHLAVHGRDDQQTREITLSPESARVMAAALVEAAKKAGK